MGTVLELLVVFILASAVVHVDLPWPLLFPPIYLLLLATKVTPFGKKVKLSRTFLIMAAGFSLIALLTTYGVMQQLQRLVELNPTSSLLNLFFGVGILQLFWSSAAGVSLAFILVIAVLFPLAFYVARGKYGDFEEYEKHKLEASKATLYSILGLSRGIWVVRQGKVEVMGKSSGATSRFGGPGALLVQQGHAVILERSGKVNRVVGSGLTWLEPYESISMVVPLQARSEQISVSHVITKDRIPIEEIETFVFHKVFPGPEDQQIRDGQFGYNRDILCNDIWSVSGNDWRESVKSITSRAVRDVIGRYNLDQILPLSDANRKMFTDELKNCINGITKGLGVEIVAVDIGGMRIPTETQARLVDKWTADWDQHVHTTRAETDKLVQLSKATARMETIQAIAEGLRQLLSSGTKPQDVIALRYIEYLEERASTGPQDDDTSSLIKLQGIQALRKLR